jgi:ADP-heptose:LPS heptosyltransferase
MMPTRTGASDLLEEPIPSRIAARPVYVYRRRRWIALFRVLDAMGAGFHRPLLGAPDFSQARTILVLKLDQIGDVVLTQPLLAALRLAAPGARIELAVGAGRGAVASLLPGIDAVRELQVRMRGSKLRIELRALWRAMRDERTRRPDVVVAAKEEPLTVLLARLIDAPVRVGYREGGLGFLLTHYLPIVGERPQHEELASLAGPAGAGVAPPVARPDEAARAEAETILRSLGIHGLEPLIVVHPGSGNPTTRWAWARFAESLGIVCAKRPLTVLVVGGDELSAKPTLDLPAPSRIVFLERPPSIPGLAALLASADVFLGNESGPSHLAAAVGTPAVVPFLSKNDPRRWGPASPHGRAVVGTAGIGPEPKAVAEAILDVLARHFEPGTSDHDARSDGAHG